MFQPLERDITTTNADLRKAHAEAVSARVDFSGYRGLIRLAEAEGICNGRTYEQAYWLAVALEGAERRLERASHEARVMFYGAGPLT